MHLHKLISEWIAEKLMRFTSRPRRDVSFIFIFHPNLNNTLSTKVFAVFVGKVVVVGILQLKKTCGWCGSSAGGDGAMEQELSIHSQPSSPLHTELQS